jgi:Tfp pilus assembly protein PilN
MLRQLYQFGQAAGVAIRVTADGAPLISACLLTLKQEQLTIDKKLVDIKHIEQLPVSLPTKGVLALNLSGKGVFTKQLAGAETIDDSNFNQVLPNGNIADFYVQQVISGARSFVAIIRRAEADRWFEQLSRLGYQPVHLSLGPFPLLPLVPDLNFYGEAIVFDGHEITRDAAGDWLKYHYNPEARADGNIKMQTEVIAENLLLPYAAAFQLVLQDKVAPVLAEAGLYQNLLTKKLEAQKLKAHAAILLTMFFLLLLVNFMLFSWLQSANNELRGKLDQAFQSTNALKVNTEHIKQQEALLQGLGWDNNLNKAALIDQIASLLPGDVLLTEINMNPPAATTSQQVRSLVFADRLIKINGLAEKILPVNEWIARLRTKPWVKSVTLENYGFNNELNTGVFSLTISY